MVKIIAYHGGEKEDATFNISKLQTVDVVHRLRFSIGRRMERNCNPSIAAYDNPVERIHCPHVLVFSEDYTRSEMMMFIKDDIMQHYGADCIVIDCVDFENIEAKYSLPEMSFDELLFDGGKQWLI